MTDRLELLIIDDDKEWADYCAKNLLRDDIGIDISYSVSDALQKIETNLYDIVFCDIKMKYTDQRGVTYDDGGFLISGKVRSHLPLAKVVMVTYYDSSAMAVKSLREERSYDYLPKADDRAVDILQIRQMIARIRDEVQKIASNPFFPQIGQTPKFIVVNRALNEKKEMPFLIQCLDFVRSNNLTRFLVLGQIGSGKSCLLMHYKRYLQKMGYLVSYYKFPPPMVENTSMACAGNLLLGILDGFPNLERNDFKHFFNGIKKIGVKINTYLVQGNMEWERSEAAPSVFKLLSGGIKNLCNDLWDRSTIAAIFLDDIHHLLNYPEVVNSLIEIFISAQLIHKPLLLGWSCLTFKDYSLSMNPDFDQILSRFFSGNMFALHDFSREEVKELVFQILSGTGVMMEEGVIDLVYDYTKGNPYATQLILHNLYENQLNGLVKLESFSKAFRDSLMELQPFFNNLYGSLSTEEIIVATMLAESKLELDIQRWRLLLVKKGMDDYLKQLPMIIDSLERKGIVFKNTQAFYHFKHIMYKQFLKCRYGERRGLYS